MLPVAWAVAAAAGIVAFVGVRLGRDRPALVVAALLVASTLSPGPATGARSRRAFSYAMPVFRVGGAAYGLGILFGIVTALTGAIDLTASWLLTACALVGLLIATNLGFERWTRRVEQSVDDDGGASGAHLTLVDRDRGPRYARAGMVVHTLAIVFVLVVKPNLAA